MLETLDVMRGLGLRPVALPGAAVPWLALGFRVPSILGRPILALIVGVRGPGSRHRCGSTSGRPRPAARQRNRPRSRG